MNDHLESLAFEIEKDRNTFVSYVSKFVISIAIFVLLGWLSKVNYIVQIVPGFAPMQFNTALGFLLCGLGLKFYNDNQIKIVKIVSSTLFLLSFFTLVQDLFVVDFGIDQLLVFLGQSSFC